MSSSGDEDNTIREYLLGRLNDEDREEFARRFFTDEELFDKLEAAEDDLIDDFLSGNLNPADVDMFRQNFLVGSKRERALRIGKAWRKHARDHAQEKPIPKPEPVSHLWQLVKPYALRIGTAVALILTTTVVVFRSLPSEIDKALYAFNAAYQQERPLESRITQLGYAPYTPNSTRGGPTKVEENELLQAEATLRGVVIKNPTPKAHHALGKVLLAKKDFDNAIEEFDEALKEDPNNAQIHADLGAASLEKGKLEIDRAKTDPDSAGKGMEYFASGLKHLNKALQLDQTLLEALYNRALVHEAMGLLPKAEEDWHQYLERDPNSKWSGEASEKLANVQQERKKTSETRDEIFERFLSQLNSGDEEGLWTTVSSYQNRSGNVVVEQSTDDYLRAITQNKKEDADRALHQLRSVGNLALHKSGDRFFFDLTRFYESADLNQRQLATNARELMKNAYAGWGQRSFDDSLVLFENARELFEQSRDHPEARVAEYWMSFCHYSAQRQKQSRPIVDLILSDCKRLDYLWLQARALYLLSAIEFDENQHSKAVDAGLLSAQLANSINDPVGLLNATSALIEYYRYLSNYSKVLMWIQRGLPLITSTALDPVQANRHLNITALAFAAMGLHDAAFAYQREALRIALDTTKDALKSQNYAFLGMLYGKLDKFDEALKNVQLAFDLAEAHSVPRMMAYATLQMGNIYRDAGDFDKAIDRYNKSIEIYDNLKLPTQVYQAHKGKFLCYLQQHNDQLAQAEISILFKFIEDYRKQISDEGCRNTFFDAEQTMVDSAIDFEFSRMKNPDQAFNYLNSSRARSLEDLINADADVASKVRDREIKFKAVSEPRSLNTIKQELPEQTQLVQYAMLEDKLLIWVISQNNVQVRMQPTSGKDLNEKLQRFLTIISRPPKDDASQELQLAKELYAILIQPVETLLDRHKSLCIIPDATLSYLSFAALVSPESGRYLFEDYPLLTSPSASVFLSCSKNASHKTGPREERLLSVGNPTFDRAAFPGFNDLPDAAKEAKEIVASYTLPPVLLTETFATRAAVKRQIESSDVIHLASHSKIDNEVPLRSELLLAKTKTDTNSVLRAYEIYNLDLSHTRLVVLSSCQSGAGHYYGGEGVSSLARAFIGAGVPLVVASLWPVDSKATEMLMVSFHKNRDQGQIPTVEALKNAQQEMARGSAENLRRPYYWAAFTVTGGCAKF
jgi:CHAT domain-containing protein/predicted negative regulator of RcsB-dependent stress response